MRNPSQERDVATGTEFVRRGLLTGGVAAGLAALTVEQASAQDAAAKPAGYDGFAFFNPREAETIEAVTERIWPHTGTGPGAKAAGAVFYIDRALDGAYAEHKPTYRRAVRGLNAVSLAEHRKPFVDLSAEQQDAVLTRLERNELVGFRGGEGRRVFDLMRTHTMEGVLSDPIYGGNRDFVGWRVVGYPGPHHLHTAEQQRSMQPLNLPLQSVADL
jgi:gluconate 2-dehydrogenase gamma chain